MYVSLRTCKLCEIHPPIVVLSGRGEPPTVCGKIFEGDNIRGFHSSLPY